MSNADKDKNALIEEYISHAINPDQLAESQVRQMRTQLSQNNMALSEEGAELLHEKMKDIMNQAVEDIGRPVLQTVSTDTLQSMIDFLQTDAGQEMVQLQPVMQEQIQAYVMENFREMGEDISEIMEEHTSISTT